MKNYILLLLVFSTFLIYSNNPYENHSLVSSLDTCFQNSNDRKLSAEEVKQRGLDLLANEIVVNLDDVDLRKMARSAIFETSYGFRWKMVNLHNGEKIIIKVDKDFKLISAKNKGKLKLMAP